MSDVHDIRRALGLPEVPSVIFGLGTTAMFFRTMVGDDPMNWVDFIAGIDFHRPVNIRPLERGTALVRYVDVSSPDPKAFKRFAFYSDPGTSPFHLGTNLSRYQYKLYNVVSPTSALVSFASTLSHRRRKMPDGTYKVDTVHRVGGGVQYIIAFGQWPKLVRVGPVRELA